MVWLLLVMLLNSLQLIAEVIPKKYHVERRSSEIKIDGLPVEDAWSVASIAGNFIQHDPVEGAPVSQQTEVRILYDNTAIYLSVILYDNHPDSILHELGNRDEGGKLNCDAFHFGIDPYNKREDGYIFEVTASGIQTESLKDDLSFDAVWQSAVHLNDSGWTIEMKIPFSAIRFPATSEQTWAVQFKRFIHRNREYDQWTPTSKNSQNDMLFWGTMDGINNIDPPLRLSMTPYFSFYAERTPVTENGASHYENSTSYYGGVDIKYGIDERFTLDMTLLPDFSQVQSDNKIKNLSAFETIYVERRPFFKEGTSLFSKGNLFYSRRIGQTPDLFYSVVDSVGENNTLSRNPDKTKLINATKISGRTNKGLGIGFFNAATANTFAEIKNNEGELRKILTAPLTNYNLFIFDQQLKNNCNVFLVNTNVIRNGSKRDANVTTAEGRFENEQHEYRITGSYSESHVFERHLQESGSLVKKDIKGQIMSIYADKINGNSRYGSSYEVVTKTYDRNDMSYIFETDYSRMNAYYTYNIFNPFWKRFREGNISLYANRNGKLTNHNQLKSLYFGMNIFLLLNNNWSIYTNAGIQPVEGRDFYEPRIAGRFYKTPPASFGSINFTTDYNRFLAFDFGGNFSYYPSINKNNLGYYITPMIRISNRFNIRFSNYFNFYKNDVGFAYLANADTSIFGYRDIVIVENNISSRYLFKNDMSISLSARHYWSKGEYREAAYLQLLGDLIPYASNNLQDNNFNSNYLTIDLAYSWQFAPGSSFLISYKNLIYSDTRDGDNDYLSNLSRLFSYPQSNSVALKFLYYLDYQYLVKRKDNVKNQKAFFTEGRDLITTTPTLQFKKEIKVPSVEPELAIKDSIVKNEMIISHIENNDIQYDEIKWSVQIYTLLTSIPITSNIYKVFENVREDFENGLYKYSTGMVNEKEEALKLLKKIHQKGFSDAFIIAFYKNKKISMKEAVKIMKRYKVK